MKILEVILTLKSHQATTWPKKIYTVLSVQQKNLKTKIIKTNQDDFALIGKFVFLDWGFLSLRASNRSGMPLGLVNFSMALWPAGCATGEFLKGRGGMDFYGL
ncbi:hypothetical protein AMTRI_Chr05g61990 [Amborella trichopoda]